jgi:uncharacterized protein YeaO (DUF488 family)
MIRAKRIYEPPSRQDGRRILVDRLWPRGLTKEKASIDAWMKELSPSTELRKWYSHDPEKWDEFRRRYFRELEEHLEAVEELAAAAKTRTVTLLFSTKEEERNNAVALAEYLGKPRRPTAEKKSPRER